ncbi:hypothetical protein GOODEAATRI_002686 [Goodea atripinnis]|uniref:non-specific serine/threonine protein kinase n=1 Tax=Goodea atripinnis TaxID=208336 RepID=A0ABV0PV84_9TELE
MSVKHAISRGLELGRSFIQIGLLKSGGRVAAKLRADRFRVGQSVRTVQPQAFLPSRYRYYRTSLTGLAAQLQSAGFRRRWTGGSPRNRAVFLAFGLGVGLIEQQLEEDRRSAATCQEIQAVFKKKRFQSTLRPFASGFKLEDYIIGNQIGKGSNAAVYAAAAQFARPKEPERDSSMLELRDNEEDLQTVRSPACCSLRSFPLAIKMLWNFGVATAAPGPCVVIDYSKTDAWAVGAISYEIFGQHNPFYRAMGLQSTTYKEKQLPPLPASVPVDVQLVISLLLRRNPNKRPSARVAANMLHLSLWGRRALANQDSVSMRKLADWLLCQSAVVLLQGCSGPSGNRVEAELQRSFLSNLELEDLRAAVGFLLYGREQSCAFMTFA